MENRLKKSDLKEYRLGLLRKQKYLCKICGVNLEQDITNNPKNIHLDHCHDTGFIRAVLCRRCNTILGKFENWYKRLTLNTLKSLDDYIGLTHGIWKYSKLKKQKEIHPTFLTNEEKRIRRNKRARTRKKVRK